MSFLVYDDPGATRLRGDYATLADALLALTRNASLVLPPGPLPGPVEIGTDAVTLHTSEAAVAVTLGPDVTTFTLAGPAAAEVTTTGAVTRVMAGDGPLTLLGGSGRDLATGGAGADRLFGGDGHDVLSGGAGRDLLDAGAGNDRLVGGEGDDVLVAGEGRTSLYGGAGGDDMVLRLAPDAQHLLFDLEAGDEVYLRDAPGSLSALLADGGQIVQSGDNAVLRWGGAMVQALGTETATLEATLRFDAPAYKSAADFLASPMARAVEAVSIGGVTYRLREAEPLHEDYRLQDELGRWWSPDYYVVVAAGQSNMVGAGSGGDMALGGNTVAWDWVNGALVPADYDRPPAGGEGVRTGTATRDNPYYPAAEAIGEALERPVLVIAHPVSGSRIDSWLSGGANRAALEGDIAAALDAVGQESVDALLWHQGESDFTLDPGDYLARLETLIAEFRGADWAGDDLAMLPGELAHQGMNHHQNAALQALETTETDPFLDIVSSVGLSTFDPAAIHFDGPSLVELGARYAEALIAMLEGVEEAPNTAPVATGAAPAALTLHEGERITLDVRDWFADAEGDALWGYAHPDQRNVFMVEGDGPLLTLSPGYDHAGSYTLSVTASDYDLSSEAIPIALTVLDRAPLVRSYLRDDFATQSGAYESLDRALEEVGRSGALDILGPGAVDGPTTVAVENLTIHGGAGIAADFALGAEIQRLDLAGGADFDVTGTDGRNYLTGNDGANALAGGADDDQLFGGAGGDILRGGTGNDRLFGGAGADLLEGGTGRTDAWGGAGADVFGFAEGDGMLLARDFTPGEDRVRLTGFDGVAGFDDLMATATRVLQSGDRALIDIGEDRLLIYNVAAADLSADHFLFG